MTHQWTHITLAFVPVSLISLLLIVLLCHWCRLRRSRGSCAATNATKRNPNSIQWRISMLHQLDTSDIKRSGSTDTFHAGGFKSKPVLFSWTDHPSLVTDVVEFGWSRFGFEVHAPPHPPVSGGSALSGIFTEDREVDISWEVWSGSADFMQMIRFNQAKKNPLTVLRGSLPLPGPQLGNSGFPQEAYFEITVIEWEQAKPFKHEGSSLVRSGQWVGEREEPLMSVGLSADGSFSSSAGGVRFPGSFAVSIGFNSDGSVYLHGVKLASESRKHAWAETNKVVGCGYDPWKKKAYFTVNSNLAHVVSCRADEFGAPLFPTMASNTEATVLVNFGQSVFAYAAANAQRTPNPCFVSSSAGKYSSDESKDLFSIGRLDSQQFINLSFGDGNSEDDTSGRRNRSLSHRTKIDSEAESDCDLFEISIEQPSMRQNMARS